MQPKFKTGTKKTTQKQYTDIWRRWSAFIEAADEEELSYFTDAAYATFLSGEHNAQISCSALRHIYDQHDFEKPGSLRDLEKLGLYTFPAPKEADEENPRESSPRHPQLKLDVPHFKAVVTPEEVKESEIVGIGSRLYRRTGSAWAEVNSLGQHTGAVLTHPYICRYTRAVSPTYAYEDVFAETVACVLAEKSTGMSPERALTTLACMAVGTNEMWLLTQFDSPVNAAMWVVRTLLAKHAEATGAAPVTSASEQTASA